MEKPKTFYTCSVTRSKKSEEDPSKVHPEKAEEAKHFMTKTKPRLKTMMTGNFDILSPATTFYVLIWSCI